MLPVSLFLGIKWSGTLHKSPKAVHPLSSSSLFHAYASHAYESRQTHFWDANIVWGVCDTGCKFKKMFTFKCRNGAVPVGLPPLCMDTRCCPFYAQMTKCSYSSSVFPWIYSLYRSVVCNTLLPTCCGKQIPKPAAPSASQENNRSAEGIGRSSHGRLFCSCSSWRYERQHVVLGVGTKR